MSPLRGLKSSPWLDAEWHSVMEFQQLTKAVSMLQGQHQGRAYDDQPEHDLTPADPRSAILSLLLEHGLQSERNAMQQYLVWSCGCMSEECNFVKGDQELNPVRDIAVAHCMAVERDVPLQLCVLHYSGSQTYLPTFEPTLHQDFWLCLC